MKQLEKQLQVKFSTGETKEVNVQAGISIANYFRSLDILNKAAGIARRNTMKTTEQIALEVANTITAPYISDSPCASDRQAGGNHYKEMGVEPWDVVDTWPQDQRIGAYRAGALKYVMRCGSKDAEVQEIEKAIHYLEKLLEVLKEKI